MTKEAHHDEIKRRALKTKGRAKAKRRRDVYTLTTGRKPVFMEHRGRGERSI